MAVRILDLQTCPGYPVFQWIYLSQIYAKNCQEWQNIFSLKLLNCYSYSFPRTSCIVNLDLLEMYPC